MGSVGLVGLNRPMVCRMWSYVRLMKWLLCTGGGGMDRMGGIVPSNDIRLFYSVY